jgi:hypothetical protein
LGRTTDLRHRIDAAMRVLAGENPDAIAAEHEISVAIVEQWCKEFCRAGEQRLRQLPENWIERLVTAAEKLVPIATLISVLLAVTLFVQGQRKEAAERSRQAVLERETRIRDAYTSLDDKYIDYVRLCLQQPDLDVYDVPIARPGPPTPEQLRRESMVLSILDSVLERAFLMYSNPNDEFERDQWSAWSAYIASWTGRANFRAEWARDRTQFDPRFTAYVDGIIQPPTTQRYNP